MSCTSGSDVTGAPEWFGGGFDGQIRLPVQGAAQDLRLFDRVLIHELTHAMVHGLARRNVPIWLHEGLAMYFEGIDATAGARRLAELRTFVPLSQLQGSFTGLTAQQAAVAYLESAVAARVLVDRFGIATIGTHVRENDEVFPAAGACGDGPFDHAGIF